MCVVCVWVVLFCLFSLVCCLRFCYLRPVGGGCGNLLLRLVWVCFCCIGLFGFAVVSCVCCWVLVVGFLLACWVWVFCCGFVDCLVYCSCAVLEFGCFMFTGLRLVVCCYVCVVAGFADFFCCVGVCPITCFIVAI